MRIILATFMVIYSFSTVFSQANEKFNLSIITHSPIVADGLGKFYNNDWFLNEAHQSIGTRKVWTIGIQTKYIIKENYALKLNCSYTTRKLNSFDKTGIINMYSGDSIVVQQNYSYKQNIINSSIGFEYLTEFKKIRFGFGLEVPLIVYGKGEQEYNFLNREFPNAVNLEWTIQENYSITNGYSIGFGPAINVTYNISKLFVLGMEFSQFWLFTKFKGDSHFEHLEYFHSIFLFDNSVNEETINYNYVVGDDFKQFGFSNPIIKLFVGIKI